MTRKRAGGFTFISYATDHPPLHVHILKGGKEIGRWDVENQRPMGSFEVGRALRRALKRLGYLREE